MSGQGRARNQRRNQVEDQPMVQQEGYVENQAEPQAQNEVERHVGNHDLVLQYNNMCQAGLTFFGSIFNEMHTMNQTIGKIETTLNEMTVEYQKQVSKYDSYFNSIHDHYDSNDDHPN